MAKRVIFGLVLMMGLAPLGTAFADDQQANDQLGLVAYWLDRGAMALAADKADEARMAFERAMLADPRQSASHANLGRAHLAMDHVTAAAKYLRTALDIDPQNLDALHWAGLVDLRADNVEAAKKKRDKLLTLCSSECPQYQAMSKAVKDHADAAVAAEAATLSAGRDNQ